MDIAGSTWSLMRQSQLAVLQTHGNNYVLCTKELRGSHTAVHGAESFCSTGEFDISCEAVVAVASDSAQNIKHYQFSFH